MDERLKRLKLTIRGTLEQLDKFNHFIIYKARFGPIVTRLGKFRNFLTIGRSLNVFLLLIGFISESFYQSLKREITN